MSATIVSNSVMRSEIILQVIVQYKVWNFLRGSAQQARTKNILYFFLFYYLKDFLNKNRPEDVSSKTRSISRRSFDFIKYPIP